MHRLHASIFVSLVVSLALASASACSSSDTGGGSTTAIDTGTADTGSTTDTGSSMDTGTTDTGTSTTDTGTTTADAANCGSAPTLHPAGDAGVYCPNAGDGGTNTSCAIGQTCCDVPNKSTPGSSCIASGSTCPTSTPKPASAWECDAPSQCGTGKICCGIGTPKLRTGCTYDEVFPAEGSKCEVSCTTGQYVICEANADCPTGKTCTPLKSGGKQVGYCR